MWFTIVGVLFVFRCLFFAFGVVCFGCCLSCVGLVFSLWFEIWSGNGPVLLFGCGLVSE